LNTGVWYSLCLLPLSLHLFLYQNRTFAAPGFCCIHAIIEAVRLLFVTWGLGFNPVRFNVRFVMEDVTLEQVFLRVPSVLPCESLFQIASHPSVASPQVVL
jgi:hypothetical protein